MIGSKNVKSILSTFSKVIADLKNRQDKLVSENKNKIVAVDKLNKKIDDNNSEIDDAEVAISQLSKIFSVDK